MIDFDFFGGEPASMAAADRLVNDTLEAAAAVDARSEPEAERAPGRTLIAPTVGLHLGIPERIYHEEWDAASNSRLAHFRKSALAVRHAIDNPSGSTKATIKGSALHCLVLEGREAFDERFAVAEQCGATTKGGARCSKGGSVSRNGEWFCGTPGHAPAGLDDDIEVLAEADMADVLGMREGLLRHPMARRMIELAEQREVSAVWTDPHSGVLCKARLDAPLPEQGVIADIKSARHVTRDAFARVIADRSYFTQAPFYIDGANANGLDIQSFAFLVVENKAPYEAAVYDLSERDIETGRRQLRDWLQRYRTCTESGEWPGIGNGSLDTITMPEWAFYHMGAD